MTFVLTSKSKTKQATSGKRGAKRQPATIQGAMDFRTGLGISAAIPTIQTKLKVGEPNDKFEQEADRVADEVMRMPDSAVAASPSASERGRNSFPNDRTMLTPLIQRLCSKCTAENDEKLQRKPLSNQPLVSALNGPLKARFEFPNQIPSIQRQDMEEDEETIRTKRFTSQITPSIQRQGKPEEEILAGLQPMRGQIMPLVQRLTDSEEAEGEMSQRKSLSQAQENPADQHSTESISKLNTGGLPLPQSLRTFYENRFGYDFGQVRIHTGSESEHLSESLHAYAFTYSNHIWLGANQPLKPSQCLAHELVHVVQQSRPPRIGLPSSRGSQPVETFPTSTPARLIQRDDVAVYWIPRQLRTSKTIPPAGKDIQDHMFADATCSPDLKQEVSIPNAARKINATGSEVGLDIKRAGQADLYLADGGKPVGIKFNPLPPPSNINTKDSKRSPIVTRKGDIPVKDSVFSIEKINEGPQWIKIGEIKPASTEQINLGKEQVQAYIGGIKLALKLTNLWASRKGKAPWNLSPEDIVPLESKDFQLNPEYTFNRQNPLNNHELILVSFSLAEGTRTEIDPRRDLGQLVRGGLYANYYNGGVWAYFSRPANPDDIFNLPNLTNRLSDPIELAQTLQDYVVNPITGAPIQPMALRKPDDRNTVKTSHSNPPLQIQRKVKEPPRVRDTFDPKQVKTAREKLHKQFKAQEKTKSFKHLQFIELAYKAEEGLDRQLPGSGRLPDKSQLAIPLKTGQSPKSQKKGKGSPEKTVIPTLYSWLKLWTNPAINVLIDFRRIFGTAFVKVYRNIVLLKTKIGDKLKEVFAHKAGGKATGTSYGALAIRALGRALQEVGKILIPQTLSLVVDSLISGVKERLIDVLPLDVDLLEKAVANEFSEIKSLGEKLEAFHTKLQEQIDTILTGFSEKLSDLQKVIDLADDLGSTIKWAIRAIQCGTPPVWGCIKLVFSSLTAWIAEKVLNYCPFQKKVGCLLADLKFISQELPNIIAETIKEKLNLALGIIDPRLSSLISPIQESPPVDCNDIGCEGEPSELQTAYERLNASLEKKWGFLGAASIMDSLLEISRKSGLEESDILTATEVDQFTKLLLEADISPLEFETLAKEFKDRSKSEEKPQSGTVQEFFDALKQMRDQMHKTGTTGGGATQGTGEGAGGITGGQSSTTDETAESGESVGLPTVKASKANFKNKIGNTLPGTRIRVENPDIKKHTAKGVYKVNLVGYIDEKPVMRVTDVPTYVPNRFYRPNNIQKEKMEILYQLRQGVCFKHKVPGVSTFCLNKETIIPAFVKISQEGNQENKQETKP